MEILQTRAGLGRMAARRETRDFFTRRGGVINPPNYDGWMDKIWSPALRELPHLDDDDFASGFWMETDEIQADLSQIYFAGDTHAEDFFPMENNNFYKTLPGLGGDIAEYVNSQSHKLQPDFSLAGAIVFVAALAMRKITDAKRTTLNMYAILSGLSGAGKDAVRSATKRICIKAGCIQLLGQERIASDSAMIRDLESRPKVLYMFDEFGRFLESLAAGGAKQAHLYGIISELLILWESAASCHSGKSYADRRQNIEPIIMPHVSVLGTTTPGALARALSASSTEDGYLPRNILVIGDERPVRNDPVVADPPDKIVDAVRALWNWQPVKGNLADVSQVVNPELYIVPSTDEAEQFFRHAATRFDDNSHKAGELLGTHWTRTLEIGRKIAIVYAISKVYGNVTEAVIDTDAARWGIAYAERSAERMIELAKFEVSDNLKERNRKIVLRKLQDLSGKSDRWVKHGELLKVSRLGADDFKAAIATLAETEQIEVGEKTSANNKKAIFYKLGGA